MSAGPDVPTSHVIVGDGPYYVKIGTAYFATNNKPTDEQCAKLEEEFGIQIVDHISEGEGQ